MTTEQPREDELEEPDVIEAPEAEGVETLEAGAGLPLEQAEGLDATTFEELDDEGRAALEEAAQEAEAAEGVERARGAGRLSANFRVAEFHCKCGVHVPGQAIPGLRRLVRQILQPMRDEFGACLVNSGYRTVRYNATIGGATNSKHVYTRDPAHPAADVRFAHGTPAQWAAKAERLLGNSGGLGIYRTFVHHDRLHGRSRWRG